jgi:hypothetical protein
MQTTEAPCANDCQQCGGPIAAGDFIPVDPRNQGLVWRHADCQTFHLTGTAPDGARVPSSSLARPDNGDLVAAAMGLIPSVAPITSAPRPASAQTPDNGDKVAAAMGLIQ